MGKDMYPPRIYFRGTATQRTRDLGTQRLRDPLVWFIIIIDYIGPCHKSANETGYATYDKGTKMDVWIKDKNSKPCSIWESKYQYTVKLRSLLFN